MWQKQRQSHKPSQPRSARSVIFKSEVFDDYILETTGIDIYFYCFCFEGLFLIFQNKKQKHKPT